MSYEDGMPAGSNGRIRGYPARMSERQQLALLMQITSQEVLPGGTRSENTATTNTTSSRSSSSSSSSSSSLPQQRGAKGRWSNKNGESPVQASINRKEDFRVRQILVNGYDINASRETNDIAGVAGTPDESTPAAPDRPCSPAETNTAAASAAAAPSGDQQEQQSQQQLYQQQQRAAGSAASAAPHVAEDSGAPCEMRRTPPQNKVDRSGTGQSGSSPRVTLRLNQVRGTRDEKKGGGASNSRQGGMSTQGQGQMETSSKTSASSSSSTGASTISGTGSTSGNASAASTDSGDVYEFKSSKEPTPVRGTSSSPNPNSDKDKDNGKASSGPQNSQNGSSGGNASTASGSSSTSVGEAATVSITTDEVATVSTSPSSKRPFESDNTDEQDEENRRKKRKDSEGPKENTKTNTTGRQSTGRNAASVNEKCVKSGKQGSGAVSGKGNQNTNTISADRKSPSTSMASSPKPSSTPGPTSTKTGGTPAPPESDGEEDRSKCSDSNSAPKVPPLKIVIPQSTTSEQEQGNRNGKNTANRSHQLPYVVASSNSNDSTDKDQSQSASGTTSPTEGSTSTKGEDKKDFSGALHGEERSTHHQRVLRSSHRTGNGTNGTAAPKETTPSSSNGNYSNSSPLPVNTSADRSNNSSPQQQSRHHSPTPETAGSDAGKSTSSESTNTGPASKSNTTVEKSEKNTDAAGKNQKDGGTETSDSTSNNVTSSATSSTSGTPAPPVDLHPRKRKMKPSKEAQQATAAANEAAEITNTGPEVHPHDQPITNCYQLFLNIRKQIERRRKGLFPVQPKPPQGFKDYLMNRCTYVLAGNAKEPNVNPPVGLHGAMKDLYVEQEKERYHLRMQHVVEKEKLVLSVEQEILRVHGRAARALANQSLPFSVCTILKDEEVYNVITPEQEEKDRNARSRYNGRLFLSWLQDVDDKWEKIKEGMVMRHHNEAESLHAVQRMHWEWKLKEVGLCESKTTPQIEDVHVPIVHVSDDFDLLPA